MITDKKDYEIRYTDPSDEKVLRKWLKFPGLLDWYPMSNEKETDLIMKNWIGFYRFKSSLTATFKGKPIGIATLLLMPYRKVAHHAMLYFIVDPKSAHQGVGTSLLKNIKHLAKDYFKIEGIHFDVYEGCPAIKLFESQGFREVARLDGAVKMGDTYVAKILMEAIL